jgi:hypothetical protein
VQLDPTTFQVQVVNSLPATSENLTVRAKVYSLENKLLVEHEEKKDAPTGVTEAFSLDLAAQVKGNVALIKLELRDSSGKLVSDNFYWLGGESADYRKLNRLPTAQLAVVASGKRGKDVVKVHVRLENKGATAAIETKLTLLESDGATRILPAYYEDNYISLLPGEAKEIDVESPSSAVTTNPMLGVRGWNVADRVVRLASEI